MANVEGQWLCQGMTINFNGVKAQMLPMEKDETPVLTSGFGFSRFNL